jgi:hypothetical protein
MNGGGVDPYEEAVDSLLMCQKKCDNLANCVAMAVMPGKECILYHDTCNDSADDVQWGYRYYQKGEQAAQHAYTKISGHCNDYTSYTRICNPNDANVDSCMSSGDENYAEVA